MLLSKKCQRVTQYKSCKLNQLIDLPFFIAKELGNLDVVWISFYYWYMVVIHLFVEVASLYEGVA